MFFIICQSIRCETLVTLKVIDLLHLLIGQGEVKDIIVFSDVLGIGRTRNGDNAALQVPAQEDLIGALSVCRRDFLDDVQTVQGTDAATASAQREPGFQDGSERGDVCLYVLALTVGMGFMIRSTSAS